MHSLLSDHGHSIEFTLFEQCLLRVLYPVPQDAEQSLHDVQLVQSVVQFLQDSVEQAVEFENGQGVCPGPGTVGVCPGTVGIGQFRVLVL